MSNLSKPTSNNSKRNKQRSKSGKATYKEQLEPLSDKRIVFIFDECHRSQFGDNHEAIKTFFPKAQLFGFTGTPIFEDNATARQIEGDEAQLKTTEDLFQQRLHAYTITHAIEDRNVLRFHVDYYKPDTANEREPQHHHRAEPEPHGNGAALLDEEQRGEEPAVGGRGRSRTRAALRRRRGARPRARCAPARAPRRHPRRW